MSATGRVGKLKSNFSWDLLMVRKIKIEIPVFIFNMCILHELIFRVKTHLEQIFKFTKMGGSGVPS